MKGTFLIIFYGLIRAFSYIWAIMTPIHCARRRKEDWGDPCWTEILPFQADSWAQLDLYNFGQTQINIENLSSKYIVCLIGPNWINIVLDRHKSLKEIYPNTNHWRKYILYICRISSLFTGSSENLSQSSSSTLHFWSGEDGEPPLSSIIVITITAVIIITISTILITIPGVPCDDRPTVLAAAAQFFIRSQALPHPHPSVCLARGSYWNGNHHHH